MDHPNLSVPSSLSAKGRALNLKQLHLFTMHLEFMLKCGIPLHRALHSLAYQSDPYSADCTSRLAYCVERGSKLSEALQQQPETFADSYVRIVQAAEQTGELESSLHRLAQNLEKQAHTRQALRSALTYPAFLLAGSAILILLMLYFVFPMVVSVTQDAGVDVPPLTQLLITLTRPQGGWTLLVGLALAMTAQGTIRRHPRWGARFQLLFEKWTPPGKFYVKFQILESTRQLGLLIDSGVDILRALSYASKVGGQSPTLAAAYEDIIRRTRLGEQLASSFERQKIFPPMLIGILAVSAEAGNTPAMLEYFCTALAEDLNFRLVNLLAALEPIMLAVLGTAIGILLIAAFMPIYNLIQV